MQNIISDFMWLVLRDFRKVGAIVAELSISFFNACYTVEATVDACVIHNSAKT